MVLNPVCSSTARCRDNAKILKTNLSIEETSGSDKHHDFNSREGIANILKGTLIPGVANVSPRTEKIRVQSTTKTLTVKHRKYGECSNLKVIV